MGYSPQGHKHLTQLSGYTTATTFPLRTTLSHLSEGTGCSQIQESVTVWVRLGRGLELARGQGPTVQSREWPSQAMGTQESVRCNC